MIMRFLFLFLIIIISCNGQNKILPNEINNQSSDNLVHLKDSHFFIPKLNDLIVHNNYYFSKKDSATGIQFNEVTGNFTRTINYIKQKNKKDNISTYDIKFNDLNGLYYFVQHNDYEAFTLLFGNDTITNSIISTYKINDKKSKEKFLKIIEQTNFNNHKKIDYKKEFNFEVIDEKSIFKFKEYNPNLAIYSTEKLVSVENPLFINRISIYQYHKNNIDKLITKSVNNINTDLYNVEIEKEEETTIDNQFALKISMNGTATLSDLKRNKNSKPVQFIYYFVKKMTINSLLKQNYLIIISLKMI